MTTLLTGTSGFLGSFVLNQTLKSVNPLDIAVISSKPREDLPFILRKGAELDLSKFSLKILLKTSQLVLIGSYTPKNKTELDFSELATESLNFLSNLLAIPLPNLKRIIYVSTTDVYTREEFEINELSKTHPSNAYTSMKLSAEELIQSFSIRNGLKYQILRFGHIYGPGNENDTKLVPNLFRSILKDEVFQLQVGLEQQMNLLYVQDAAKVLVETAKGNLLSGVYNVVSQESISVDKIIQTVEFVTKKKLKKNQTAEKFDNALYNFAVPRIFKILNVKETKIEEGFFEMHKSLSRSE
jgi:UDP-glucose 4-epimerase